MGDEAPQSGSGPCPKGDAAAAVTLPAAPAACTATAPAAERKKRKHEEQAGAGAKAARVEAPCLVVFGLGNVGPESARQRHNLGARVVAALAARLKTEAVPDCDGAVGTRRVEGPGRPKLLLPPQGEINSSGPALQAALAALGHPSAAFLVVVDDCSLPLGTIRLKAKSSSGGHNGLKSIEAIFGQGYHRLKLGIGGARNKEHVVGEFEAGTEAQAVGLVLERAAEGVELWLAEGPEHLQKVQAVVNSPTFRQPVTVASPAPASVQASAGVPKDPVGSASGASLPAVDATVAPEGLREVAAAAGTVAA